MATPSKLRRELADERTELTEAVAELREELGHAAERGKRAGATVAAAAGGLLALRAVWRAVRRRR
jgi:hypothetical protein